MPMAKKKAQTDPYPPLYIEALAYHESGHAVMAVLLDLPISKIVIGPACEDPEYNGRVILDLDSCSKKIPIFKAGLLEVASEQAEKLCPRFDQFKTIHKSYPLLKPFKLGVKADLIRGFEAVSVVYVLLGLAESTAKRQFKVEYRDRAAKLIEMNATAVCRLAEGLIQQNALSGSDAAAVILSDGPLKDGGLLKRFGQFEQPRVVN